MCLFGAILIHEPLVLLKEEEEECCLRLQTEPCWELMSKEKEERVMRYERIVNILKAQNCT